MCSNIRIVSRVVVAVVSTLLVGATDAQQGTGRPAASPGSVEGAKVEQRSMGEGPAAQVQASFDGLGVGLDGPHGTSTGRNPSDNSVAVGPNHIVQTVNSKLAIFTKQGAMFETTGRVLVGAVNTNTLFAGFGGTCEARNNGDAVVRYDQLANRWLVVMPIFRRAEARDDQPAVPKPGGPAQVSVPGVAGQPGAPAKLAPPETTPEPPPTGRGRGAGAGQPPAGQPPAPTGPFSMCYAISTTDDPTGEYYRYEFLRPLFPDYPRPAVWPDGYYVPTSTGDDVIEKHACVVERAKMLKGEPASEQCLIIGDVNFLNNADLDGTRLPPSRSPNMMLATGGSQLTGDLDDDGVYVWNFVVDWDTSSKTMLSPVQKIPVAPYTYLCGGQLTNCVPQVGAERRLDAQGDKLMARVVYRRVAQGRASYESVVAVHSVDTESAAGGVRWYEFRVNPDRSLRLYQQGTYAPDGNYRWMASPAIDKFGNIGIGYSFGGPGVFAGQRFSGRRPIDPPGQLALREVSLVEGAAAQTNTLRWQDYSQTAIDPSDDCTIWYVGDYYKEGASSYSTRIGGFKLPGC
ncbi:MAG: hypothetical protein HQ485_08025 [Acidobacteria bacterium]|jgi:hypothetical protein|nr:hypothetical protein [Acidobacteriota bacterium]